MKYDVATIGGAVFDLFIRPEKESILRIDTREGHKMFLAFPHGEKLEIDDIHQEFGGGAANVAVGVSTMGLRSAVAARVGADYYGKEILRNLKTHKVSVDAVEVVKDKKSGFSIIINSYDGERTVLYSRGANDVSPQGNISKFVTQGTWVHITSLPKDSDVVFKQLTVAKKKRPKLMISWNPGAHQFRQGLSHFRKFFPLVDVLFLNREEIEAFFGKKTKRYARKIQKEIMTVCHDNLVAGDDFLSLVYDVSGLAKRFLTAGVKRVVVTDGRRGSQYFDTSHHYYVPCGESKPVSTLGAGDAFCSGFIAGMIYTKNEKTALAYGTVNAGSVVSSFGAQKGILTKMELGRRAVSLPVLVMR